MTDTPDMDVYVARQPIFDRKKALYAYELLFRGGMDNYARKAEGDSASTQVLSNSFFTIGIEKITGGKKAFINFTQNLLQAKLPLAFPKELTVVEILESVRPDEELLAACMEIKQKGYLLALDDFEYRPELQPLVSLAHIIKLDFKAASLEAVAESVRFLSGPSRKLLAEKIETHQEFEAALALGFDYFQGYFFCEPEVIRGKELSSYQTNLLQIMSETAKEDFDYDIVEMLIGRDVGISYKLLKYINCAFYMKQRQISSIKQAIVYLGMEELRRFISLIAMTNLVSGKPDELVRASCIRGRLCESLAGGDGLKEKRRELFTLGLFSLLDAMLDQNMDKLMNDLPLSSRIKEALIRKTGNLSDHLRLVQAYETGKWDEVSRFAERLGLEEAKLPELYVNACSWGETFLGKS